tara:strand:- start:28132 stop:28686 length:555 start_codon:yes stop_codon:yes gene_type:complete
MKKLILILCCCYTTIAFSQKDSIAQNTEKKNEITLNALTLVASGWIDVSYEYLINNESSFGVDLQFGFDENNNVDNYRNFSITPNYRVYFSNKYAKGFFIEGFGMLHRYKDYFSDDIGYNNNKTEQTEFSLGISVGGKWVTKSGFVTEIFGGIGRNLLNSNDDDDDFDPTNVAGRIGISIGKRF